MNLLTYFRFAAVVVGLLVLSGACTGGEKPLVPENRPPEIRGDIGFDPPDVKTSERVFFSLTSAYDPDEDVLAYVWQAERGEILNPTSDGPTYQAPEVPGTGTVSVVVIDRRGGSASKSIQFDVVPHQAPTSAPPNTGPEKTPIPIGLTLTTIVEPPEAGAILVVPLPDLADGYLPKTNLVAIATPNDRFRFVAWAGDSGGTENPLVFAITTNSTLVAVFSPTSPTLLPVQVFLVEMIPDTVTLAFKEEIQLAGIPKTATGNVLTGRLVTWSSSDGSVATVSENGLVKGVGIGAAKISATIEGKTVTAIVKVVEVVGGDFIINVGGIPYNDLRVTDALFAAVPWLELTKVLFGGQDVAIVIKRAMR